MAYPVALACALIAGCTQTKPNAGPKVNATEPRPGKIKSGIKVLVDDGSCAPGQIKQVTGGSTRLGIDRQYHCIAGPADLKSTA